VGNIGSIPNFDRLIEPHSWLRWWSRITKFIFKMADGRHIAKCWKRYNSAISGPIWMKLNVHIPPCPRHVRHDAVAMATEAVAWQRRPLPSNGALYIQQLWASEGRTREPILIKIGTHQQIRTTMTVTWSNIKIFKIQNSGRPPCWIYSKCHNSPTNGPTWDPTWVVTSHHVPHDAVAMATAVAQRIEYSAVMGVWRLNAWTNFGKIWYTTAS